MRSQEGTWSQGVIFLLSWDEVWESSLILHAGCPTDSNSNRDINRWVNLCVFSVTVMESELFVLSAGRCGAGSRAVMLGVSTRLAEEAALGFYVLNQLLFRERGKGSCCNLWWFDCFKQSFGSWGLAGCAVRAASSLRHFILVTVSHYLDPKTGINLHTLSCLRK